MPIPKFAWVVVAFSPDGKTFATGEIADTVKVWDVADTSLPIVQLTSRRSRVSSLTFLPDGRHLVVAGLDKTVKLWNVNSGTLLTTL
ncbi:MAG: hypothetical protein IH892_15690 [Planctomycetes bacterium]|nr:hypothetical protein [Planctomycetota bacterium]